MRINYDFSDLEAFLAVMETGAFHLAAERLGLSQPAISRRVQKLESVLDTVLFERSTRAVKPTLAAKRLKTRAEALLNDAHETALAMRDESVALSHQRNMVVSVATIPTVVKAVLPQAIRRFRQSGFAARIRFLDLTTNAVVEAVSQGDADFGISSTPALERSIEFEPLLDDRMMLVLPSAHPLSLQEEVSWHELAGETLILPTRGTGNRLLIDEAMARERLQLGWTFEVHRSTTALDLVAGNAGVALVPKSAITSGYAHDVVARPMVSPEIVRPVGLISRVGHTDSPVVQCLKSAIRAENPRLSRQYGG